jgi:hypothetical protein
MHDFSLLDEKMGWDFARPSHRAGRLFHANCDTIME